MKLFFAFIDLILELRKQKSRGGGPSITWQGSRCPREKRYQQGLEVLKKEGEGLNAMEDSWTLLDPSEGACFKGEKQLGRACFNLGVRQRRNGI